MLDRVVARRDPAADQAGHVQRQAIRSRKYQVSRDQQILGKSAANVPWVDGCPVFPLGRRRFGTGSAEVLPARQTIVALATLIPRADNDLVPVVEEGPLALVDLFDCSGDLMAEDGGKIGFVFPFQYFQIGVTDSAGSDSYQDFSLGSGTGNPANSKGISTSLRETISLNVFAFQGDEKVKSVYGERDYWVRIGCGFAENQG